MSLRYLLTALEPLDFAMQPKMSAYRVIEMFQLNLSASEFEKFQNLQFMIDIQNLLQGMCDQKIDTRSSKSLDSFEKRIREKRVPLFVLEFYKKYTTSEERTTYFSALFRDSLDYIEDNNSGFLAEYCRSEKELLAFLCSYRAVKASKNVHSELFFEDSGDLFMASVLQQKDEFTAPYEFQGLFDELEGAKRNPLKEYKAVAKYRFNLYYEYVKDYGSIENALFAYFVCLVILEDMVVLDKSEGLRVVKRLVESGYAAE